MACDLVTLTLGTYEFCPVPVVDITKNYVRTGSGKAINIIKSAQFTGTLVDTNTLSPNSPLVMREEMDQALCNCDSCVPLLLKCGDDTVLQANVRVLSINWGPSADNWTHTIPISLNVEWDAASEAECVGPVWDVNTAYNLNDIVCYNGLRYQANTSVAALGSAPDISAEWDALGISEHGVSCQDFLKEISDTWSIEYINGPHYYDLNDCTETEWDGFSSYVLDDLVCYNGAVYKALTNISPPGSAPDITPLEWELVSPACNFDGPQFLQVTHNISAQANDGCAGETVTPGWQISKDWVELNAGLVLTNGGQNIDCLTDLGVFNFDPELLTLCSTARSSNIDKHSGGFSLQEIFLISTDATNCCLEDWTVESSSDAQSRLKTFTISGQITGYEDRLQSDYHTVVSSKIETAKACWALVEPDLAARVACCVDTGDCPINSVPRSSSVSYSPTAGTVNYNFSYDNRPENLIAGSVWEEISISDVNPTEIVAEIPIPGRTPGPLLVASGTQVSRRRTLNIQIVMPYNDGCPTDVNACTRLTSSQLNTSQKDAIKDFICCVEDELVVDVGPNGFVARIEDTYSESIKDGVYNRTVTWIYQDCDFTLADNICP